MTKNLDEIQNSFLFLLDTFYEGLLAFIVYRGIVRRYREYPTDELDIFIYTISITSIKTMSLATANHLQNDRNSITLTYLENIIRNSKKEFDDNTYESLIATFDKLNEAREHHKDLIERVRIYRDQIVAHIDRIRVNNPNDLLERKGITVEDFEALISLVGGALFELGENLGLSPEQEDLTTISNFLLEQRTFRVYDFIQRLSKQ